jgi:hypothetical protein
MITDWCSLVESVKCGLCSEKLGISYLFAEFKCLAENNLISGSRQLKSCFFNCLEV